MELVDTHCHLQFKALADNIDKVMAGAQTAGVKRMLCVGTSLKDSQQAIAIAKKHDNVWASVGAHPHDGADFLKIPDAAKILNKLSKLPRVVAIGEIGLDYFHENSSKIDQQKILHAQIEATLESGLPYIFHVRDAWADFWPIFDEYKIKKGVIHSFSSGPKQLNHVLSRGLVVGLNGIMTFTKDQSQLEAAKMVPLDKLLVETDSPFLAPVPYRGQTCEPKHVADTARFLADLKDMTLQDLAVATTANAIKLFGLKND